MITWLTLDAAFFAACMVYFSDRELQRDRRWTSFVGSGFCILFSVPPAIYCVLYLLLPAYGVGH